eukprot:8934873-Heterocapsa_arctica.AAC.1
MKVKSELAWSSWRLRGSAMSGSAAISPIRRCPSGSTAAAPAVAWLPGPPGEELVEAAPGVERP